MVLYFDLKNKIFLTKIKSKIHCIIAMTLKSQTPNTLTLKNIVWTKSDTFPVFFTIQLLDFKPLVSQTKFSGSNSNFQVEVKQRPYQLC